MRRLLVVLVALCISSPSAWADGEKRSVSVLGAVNSPGNYELKPNQNLYDVIAKAGGFNDVANRKKIKVVRNNGEGKKKSIQLDFPKDVIALDETETTEFDDELYLVQEGDLVFVSKSRIRQAGEILKSAIKIVSLGAMTGAISGAVN